MGGASLWLRRVLCSRPKREEEGNEEEEEGAETDDDDNKHKLIVCMGNVLFLVTMMLFN